MGENCCLKKCMTYWHGTCWILAEAFHYFICGLKNVVEIVLLLSTSKSFHRFLKVV